MSVYSETMDELEFDPTAPGPELEEWVPWTVRGAIEVLTGDRDRTVWTEHHVQELTHILSLGSLNLVHAKGNGHEA